MSFYMGSDVTYESQTADNGVNIHFCDCTSESIVLTLAEESPGLVYFIKRIDSVSMNTLTIDTADDSPIDGSLTRMLLVGQSVMLYRTNENEWITFVL